VRRCSQLPHQFDVCDHRDARQRSEEMKVTWYQDPTQPSRRQTLQQFGKGVSRTSSRDVQFFGSLKKHLGGHRFQTDAEVQEAITL
jgi:hypothetical protein